ncbi:MAG TPA: N-acetylmuramoyl-L-alanine amidase [Gemmatimonadota bacterium]|nr:N-acetylmuramoyl-L-alanine amidase [Gemmatimonadota bacterium]
MSAGPIRRSAFRATAVAWLVLAWAAGASAQTATVAVDGVPRSVPLIERQGHRFVALEDVAGLLGGRIAEQAPERAVLDVDGVRLVVRRRLPFVEVDGKWYQMVDPAQKDERGFWLPASSLTQLLPVVWPGRFPTQVPGGSVAPNPRPEREEPREEPGRERGTESGMIGDLRGVDVWVEPGRTRLDFHIARVPGVEVDDGLPGTLQLRLAGVSIPARVARGLAGVGLVDSVSVTPAGDGSAITFWLDPGATLYAVAPLRRPSGLEVVLLATPRGEVATMLASDVSVRRADVPRPHVEPDTRPEEPAVALRTGDAPVVVEDAPREPAPIPVPHAPGDGWTIVLDAGHGGRDAGAIGPNGVREKEVTLAVVRRLADRLGGVPGVRVVLTRDRDEFVALGERTRIANREKADLFVSIHANSAENRTAEGFETYFLSAAKTEDARRVARMENSAVRYENPSIDPESLGELNFILWDLAQNEYLRESSTQAESVQEEIDRRLALRSRGVKQAGFFVLNGAFMPAILFEMAFISNPKEESLLDDPAFQNRIADGLAESLLAHLDRYSRKVYPASAAR